MQAVKRLLIGSVRCLLIALLLTGGAAASSSAQIPLPVPPASPGSEPLLQESDCITEKLDVPLQGEFNDKKFENLNNTLYCKEWTFHGRGGDRLALSLERGPNSTVVPILSVYVTPEGAEERYLLDQDMDLTPLNPGAKSLEIVLDNLLTNGTYAIEVKRIGGANQEFTPLNQSNAGEIALEINVTRQTKTNPFNLLELKGRLPVVEGGGVLACAEEAEETRSGRIEFGPPAPGEDAEATAGQITRDNGDRWVFYGKEGQAVDFRAVFDEATCTSDFPGQPIASFATLDITLWYKGRVIAHDERKPIAEDDYTLAIQHTLAENGYYILTINAMFDIGRGERNLPPVPERVLDYDLKYDGSPCQRRDPTLDDAGLSDAALTGLGFPGGTTGVFNEDGTVTVTMFADAGNALTLVTHPNSIAASNIGALPRNSDEPWMIKFVPRGLEIYLEPGLVRRLAFLEEYITVELKNGRVFVTQLTDDTSRNMKVFTEKAAIRIEAPSGQTFVSDWDYPGVVWAIHRRFFVLIDSGAGAAGDPTEQQWVSAEPIDLQMLTDPGGHSSISPVLSTTDVQTRQELVVDWQNIKQVSLQTGNTIRIWFGADNQFITDILDTITITTTGSDTTINLEASGQSVTTTITDIRAISLLNESIHVDFETRTDITESFAEGTTFAEEKFTFGAEEPVRTGNVIIEREDGTREMLLDANRHIVTPPPGEIVFNPELTSGSINLAQSGQIELALPHDMNNRGAEFCAECGTMGPYWGLVNPANGNMMYAVTDIYVPGPGLDLALTRTYNSLNPKMETRLPRPVEGHSFYYGLQTSPVRAFGPGWSSDLDVSLDLTGSLIGYISDSEQLKESKRTGFVMLNTASGSQHYFYRDLDAVHGVPSENAPCDDFHIPYYSDTARGWEVRQCLAEWQVVRDDNLTYHFDRAGQLTYISHSNGYAITLDRQDPTTRDSLALDYPANDFASELGDPEVPRERVPQTAYALNVKTPEGKYIRLYYGYFDRRPETPQTPDKLRVLRADAPDGARTYYHYNLTTGDLDAVFYPDGRAALYKYEADTHRLIQHSDPRAPWLPYLQYTYGVSDTYAGQLKSVYAFNGAEGKPDERVHLLEHNYEHDPKTDAYVATVLDVQRDRQTRFLFDPKNPYQMIQRLDESELAGSDIFLATSYSMGNTAPLEFPRFFTDGMPVSNALSVLKSVLYATTAEEVESSLTFGFDFDPQGHLRSLVETRAQTINRLKYEYGEFGQLASLSFTDGVDTGSAWQYVYGDEHGMLTQATDPEGNITTFCYAPATIEICRTTSTSKVGCTSEKAKFYRLAWEVGPYKQAELDAILPGDVGDLCGWLSANPDELPAGFTLPATSFGYDDAASEITRVRQWRANGSALETEIRRDVMGRITSVDGPREHIEYKWGAGQDYDRLVSIVEHSTAGDATTRETCYTYTAGLGQLESVTDPLDRRTVYAYYDYANLHRLESVAYYHDARCGEAPDDNNRLYTHKYTYTACLLVNTTNYAECASDPPPSPGARVKDLYIRVDEVPGANLGALPAGEPLRYTVYRYDENDALAEIVERRQEGMEQQTLATCFQYDATGNLTAYADGQYDCAFLELEDDTLPAGGRYFTFDYNLSGQLLAVTDRMFEGEPPRTWRFDYTSQFGGVDNRRWPVTLTNPAHTRAWPGLERYTEITYDNLNRPVEVREYDRAGSRRLLQTTAYTYDAWGNVTRESVTAPLAEQPQGPVRYYCYDNLNRLVSIRTAACDQDAAGALLESFVYDAAGNLRTVTQHRDGQSFIYTLTYDGFNRLVSIKNPRGHMRYFGYNAVDELTYETDWNGYLTTYGYEYQPGDTNADKRRVVETCQHVDATDIAMPIDADALGSLHDSCEAEQMVVSEYDALGRLRFVTFHRDQYTFYAYDWWDRLAAARTRVGETRLDLIYAYDRAGNLISITNSQGETYNFEYDARGNLTRVQDARSYAQQYTYDANNNLIVFKDEVTGQVIDFFYDGLNRLDCMVYRANGQSDREARCNDLGFNVANLVDFSYDAAGNIIQVVQRNTDGSRSLDHRYTYADFTWLKSATVTDSAATDVIYNGWRYEYAYNPEGLAVTAYPPGSISVHPIIYQYDALGHLVRIDAPGDGGTETGYTLNAWYDGSGALCGYQVLGGPGKAFDYAAAMDGKPRCAPPEKVAGVAPGSVFNFYTYTRDGKLATIAPTGADAITYEYNNLARLERVLRPGIGSTYYYYDDKPDGTDVYTLDPLQPGGCDSPTGEATANLAERIKSINDDPQKWAGQCRITRLTYNRIDELVALEQLPGSQNLVQFVYDSLDNLTRAIDADGQSILWAYDRMGEVTRFEDRTGASIQAAYTSDRFYRLSGLTNSLNETLTLFYDSFGRLKEINNEQDATTIFRFDALNRLVAELMPIASARIKAPGEGDPATRWFTYDELGNLVARRDGGAETPIRYEYDAYGRPGAVIYPQDEDYRYAYDLGGNITRIEVSEDIYWTYTWEYVFGRDGEVEARLTGVEEVRPESTRHITVSYDAFGHRDCLALSENGKDTLYINYDYSLTGQLERIAASDKGCIEKPDDEKPIYHPALGLDPDASCNPGEEDCCRSDPDDEAFSEEACAEFSYTYPEGYLSSIARSNGLCTTYTYDTVGNIARLEHTDCQPALGESPLQISYEYEIYDGNGAPQRITVNTPNDGERVVLFSYDGAGRLTDERWLNPNDELDYAMSIAYDPVGNRRTVSVNGEMVTYCYDPLGQQLYEIRRDAACPSSPPLSCTGPVGALKSVVVAQFAYDGSGRLCRRADHAEGQITDYVYDDEGRLAEVARGGDHMILSYDPLGQVRTIETTTTANFLHDEGRLLFSQDGREIRYFVGPVGGAPLWARVIDIERGERRIEWLLYDGLDSVRLLTDEAGAPKPDSAFDYNAFGAFLTYNEDAWGPRYQGRYWTKIANAGLYVFGSRAYDPDIARYLQPDPQGPDNANQRYFFMQNHPTPGDQLIALPDYPALQPPEPPVISPALMGLPAPLPPVADWLFGSASGQPHVSRGRADILDTVGLHWSRNGARWWGVPPALYVGYFAPLPVEAFGAQVTAHAASSPWHTWEMLADLDQAHGVPALPAAAGPDLRDQLDRADAVTTPFQWPAPAQWRGAARPDYGVAPEAPGPVDTAVQWRAAGLLDRLASRFDDWPRTAEIITMLADQTPGDMLNLPADMQRLALWLGVRDTYTWPYESDAGIVFETPDGILSALHTIWRQLFGRAMPLEVE
ncbi:MAG: hypothetical protein JXB47_02160 [Anaerolineae bacterium]|nr:hypothetical protein [Anaerolineae bacterium]